jgi:hypothetical protein
MMKALAHPARIAIIQHLIYIRYIFAGKDSLCISIILPCARNTWT